ncbi:hypothetical protein J6590_008922 [Homalodisca vitripennis]|nr:hypothetical protein J6590_008922 [Homalodisca vitripennis]
MVCHLLPALTGEAGSVLASHSSENVAQRQPPGGDKSAKVRWQSAADEMSPAD